MALPTGRPGTPVDPVTPTGGGADWPRQATEQVVKVVDTVRDKTTGPVLTAARATVFGLLALIAVVILVVLVIIAAVRGITELTDRAWLTYLVLGGLFTLTGLVLWRRRRPRGNAATS
jgi:hypothetical protein